MAFYLRFAGMACRYGLRNVLKSNHVYMCVCVEVPYESSLSTGSWTGMNPRYELL